MQHYRQTENLTTKQKTKNRREIELLTTQIKMVCERLDK